MGQEVQRHWQCPACDDTQAEVVAALAEAEAAGRPVVCAVEGLKGRMLVSDTANGFSQCEFFISERYAEAEHAEKSPSEFLYWTKKKDLKIQG